MTSTTAHRIAGRRLPGRGNHAATNVFWLSTVAIFCQPSILRNLMCPLATRLKSSTTAASSLGSEPVGATNDHPDFTQELPRKLLPTRTKEAQRRGPEKR